VAVNGQAKPSSGRDFVEAVGQQGDCEDVAKVAQLENKLGISIDIDENAVAGTGSKTREVRWKDKSFGDEFDGGA
jgi:hypothetical protein